MLYKYLIIAVILFIAELIYFRIALHFGIVDKPNLRSSHKKVTILGGGIIFPLAMWLWALFFEVHDPWFLMGLSLVALVSFADDIWSVPNAIRLVVQFLAIFLIFWDLGILQLSMWWIVLVAWIVCVGIVNAFNFMDGINGITGGYSLAVLLSLMAVYKEIWSDMSMLIVLGIGLLIFCFFNFRTKARCFAGDVGAVSMAFVMIFLIGCLINTTKDFSYILFLAVYGVDTVLTIIHRIKLKEHLGKAHRKHMYQIMANELNIPHVVVSLIYIVVQLLVSAGLIWLPVNHYLYAAAVLLVLCIVYIVFMKKYYHLHEEYLESVKADKN